MTPARAPARRRGKAGLLILAFVAMLAGAFALMTNFTGSRPPSPVPTARASPTPVAFAPSGLAIPVAGAPAITDSWGDAREGGARAHHGTDIIAPAGTPVLAAAAGTVEKLFDSAAGGHTVYVRSPDRRWSYYYAHLARYADGLYEGQRVIRGQRIAYVGDTGNAGAGNYHLHFGISRMAPDEGWAGGQPINPYPLLVGGASRR